MRKYIESIKPFFVLTICFTILLFCIKSFELFSSDTVKLYFIAEMIYSNLIASLLLSFCVFIIFNIISIFSKKVAFYFCSILFSIIIISEICLIFYYKSTGLLMGNELIERPLWETIATVKSTLNFWMIASAILLIIAFTFINYKIVKRQQSIANSQRPTAKVILLLMLISIPLFFVIKPNQNDNSINKIWYCFYSCFMDKEAQSTDIVLSKLAFDEEKIEIYKSIFPEREISDEQYPLERTDNINNVLGPYFKKSEEKPNIVFIIVESLGTDLFGVNQYDYTFTPFLDSLSKHSLLWTNCLSTTPRSFGAVPAITGSVPHGLKGFQFGDIPEYNSLFSILKDNDYKTNAFYAGEYSFDKVYDYLVSQKIDFMAPLFEDHKKKENKHLDFTYWGYQDLPMFDKSMEIIENRDEKKSYFDLFITISQHDNRLKLNDKDKTDKYYEKVSEIISTLPESEHSKMNDISGYLAATLYGDDAIKHFVKKYSEYYKDGNYIFVITGDHSLNINSENPLNGFHVPLIIWSPMLEKTDVFNSVVSHNDIVPTLNALFRDSYYFKTPEKIHWVGEELDTIKEFHCDLKTCFLRYTRTVFDGVYENYYYDFSKSKKAYIISENLELTEVNDENIINNIDENFKALIYADNYSYTNNKVCKNPIFPQNKFKVISEYIIDSVYCSSLKEKPSVKKPKAVNVISDDIKSIYSEIKIIMTADVTYTGEVWQDQFISLGVDLTYDKGLKINASDNISKSFSNREYHPNETTKLEFTKVFNVKDFDDINVEIYLKSTEKDYMWNPEHSVMLKNINIKILGS